jgi:hypothetical protein
MSRRPWRVEIEWQDSQVIGGAWDPIPDLIAKRSRVTCYSVGFVLADDKRGIVLASSINGANAAGVTIIPRRQIVKRRRLG